jgi:hypothetical protein
MGRSSALATRETSNEDAAALPGFDGKGLTTAEVAHLARLSTGRVRELKRTGKLRTDRYGLVHEESVLSLRLRAPRAGEVDGETAALVFADLREGKTAAEIVIARKLAPSIAIELLRAYAVLSASVLVAPAELQRIADAQLGGHNLLPRTGDEIAKRAEGDKKTRDTWMRKAAKKSPYANVVAKVPDDSAST